MTNEGAPKAAAPIRIGLVGLGRAGWGMHAKELEGREEQFVIHAAYDALPARRSMALEAGIRAYDSLEALLQDDEVELVDIATRSSDHYAHASMALAAGKDVLVEKPLTQTYDEARRLFEEAAERGRRIFVRHNRRYDPDFLHVRELIDSGLLGSVHLIRLCRHSYQRRKDWQTIKQFGGGQLLNWGPHIIDHGLRLLGAPVVSHWSHIQRVVAAGDAEDHLKIVLKGANDRLVDIEISGGVAIGSPTFMAHGDRGSLSLTGATIHLKYIDPNYQLAPQEADPGTPGEAFGTTGTYDSGERIPWLEETIPVGPKQPFEFWSELFESYRGGKPFRIATEEALEVVRLIEEVKRGTPFA